MLWEMLTGAPPFRGSSLHEVLTMHVSRPAPMRQLSHLPESLQAIVARLLVKDPEGRFANAAALVKALERCRARLESGTERAGEMTSAPELETAVADETVTPPARPRTEANLTRRILLGSLGAVTLAGLMAAGPPIKRWFQGTAVVSGKSPTAAAPSELSRKTVAVLPFENIGGRPEDAYLADGLQEEILNALARLRDLKVISRTSVKGYRGNDLNIREIGQRLGAGTIIEGSVRREGDTVRLTIQVIDARDDSHLLSTTYDRDFNKVLELQSAVAKQVATALSATLTRQERGELDRVATTSGDAYDRYLRAVAAYRWESVKQFGSASEESKRLLEESIRMDPNFSDAYAFLSQIYTTDFTNHADPKLGDVARQAYERAFAIDPQLPEAKLARGLHALYVDKNLDQALNDLGEVVVLRPNSAEAQSSLGLALRRAGRSADSIAPFSRAYEIDPLNLRYGPRLGQTLLGLRRFPEAFRHQETILARFPGNGFLRWLRAYVQSRLQRSSEPLQAVWRAMLLEPNDRRQFEAVIAEFEGRYLEAAKIWEALPDEMRCLADSNSALLYHAAGDSVRAEENFRAAETHALEMQKLEAGSVNLIEQASVQSMLGHHDAALATIDQDRATIPESRDAVNGPRASFVRSIILVRAGRTDEGYAEVARLLRVPYGSPISDSDFPTLTLAIKDDPHFDEMINNPAAFVGR